MFNFNGIKIILKPTYFINCHGLLGALLLSATTTATPTPCDSGNIDCEINQSKIELMKKVDDNSQNQAQGDDVKLPEQQSFQLPKPKSFNENPSSKNTLNQETKMQRNPGLRNFVPMQEIPDPAKQEQKTESPQTNSQPAIQTKSSIYR